MKTLILIIGAGFLIFLILVALVVWLILFVMDDEDEDKDENNENDEDESRPSDASRLQHVRELRETICAFEESVEGPASIETWLDSVAILAGAEEGKDEQDKVTLMTIHKAKGLEFDVVFGTGLENGALPKSSTAVEEERRLFYVMLTRARAKLYLTSTAERYDPGRGTKAGRRTGVCYGPPSIFLREIPNGLLQKTPT